MFKNPLQYSISSLLMVTSLVAVGVAIGPAIWLLIGVVEFVFVCGLLCWFRAQMPSAVTARCSEITYEQMAQ